MKETGDGGQAKLACQRQGDGSKQKRLRGRQIRKPSTVCTSCNLLVVLLVVVSSIGLLRALVVSANPRQQATNEKMAQHGKTGVEQTAQRSDVDAELEDAIEGSKKLLAEAIISRLMMDNLNGSGMSSSGASSTSASDLENEIQAIVGGDELGGYSETGSELSSEQAQLRQGPDAQRLGKLMNFLQNYDAGYLDSHAFSPFPLLPSGQAATMKRAAAKMNAYLQAPQRHVATPVYGRNNFDFGLGKRPDSSMGGNILRFGDSSMGINGGSIQSLGSYGKRVHGQPSPQRFDFGLGKRVATPAYPRFDFGLGKRAPSRLRYDFGLGK